MKVTLHFRKGLVEKVMSNVWQSLSIFLSAKQKKILLVGVLLLHIFSASFSQKEPVFLSGYDSCQRSPRQIQTRLGIQALSSSAQVRLAYVIPSNRTAQPDESVIADVVLCVVERLSNR